MLKKILQAAVLLIISLFGYAAFQPADYKISRQISIDAPADKIFPFLNNMKLADQWGPWKETDPEVKMTLTGPEEGVGAVTAWESPGQMGTGSATIVNSVQNQQVNIRLEYTKPSAMNQDSVYLIEANADGKSVVSWTVTGKNNVVGRVFCLFVNVDKMVGSMFEMGLSKLKTVVETATKK